MPLLRSVVVIAALFSLVVRSLAARCALDPSLSLGQEIALESKLSISGFVSPTYTYATLPAGSDPFLKILAASEEPVVTSADGVLYISTGSCKADPSPTVAPSESEDDESPTSSPTTSSAQTMWTTGVVASVVGPRVGWATTLVLSLLLGNLPPVWGQDDDDCTPTLEIEISLPAGAGADTKFGDTDHYVPANVDTAIWGWFDPFRDPVLTMQSGETVTMEGITSVCGHDYAKMIRGDQAVEEFFAWYPNETLVTKASPKLPGSGPHPVTGPIEVAGAEPGDVLQVDILEVDPRPNAEGRTFGSNAQKFNGYHFRFPKRDGTDYVFGDGSFEALTIMEFLTDDDTGMMWGKPVYMFRPPNMILPDNTTVTYDTLPAIYPHEYNYGYNMTLLEEDPIEYPEGFDGFVLDQAEIEYLSPDPAMLNWKVPLRPHMGVLAVTPANATNWDPNNGLNTIPPARFGGNVDDWRIGKGGTMYYVVEIPGAMLYMGDTHAAQGDSELAGTAMETSLTSKLRLTLHKADSLPKKVATLNFPLLETSSEYVIHGFAYNSFLEDLDDPTTIFAEGATLDLAMEDCFVRTRNWLMDVMDMAEEETIALMSMGVDFGVTQVVDANWGVHADIAKWLFGSDTTAEYSCNETPSRKKRRMLKPEDRHQMLQKYGLVNKTVAEYADALYKSVTSKKCKICQTHPSRTVLAYKLLDAKLAHLHKLDTPNEHVRRIQELMEQHFEAVTKGGGKLRR